ncbi:MAG: patatin-like phospholipase family protein [Ideonella sp.]|nr:patatin-like phospholipase family protein [Ideonella sp.]
MLRAIARLRREHTGHRGRMRNPFGVIVGTSAGAINAAALACQADRFEAAVELLARVWHHFRSDQVYRADTMAGRAAEATWRACCRLGRAVARWRREPPRSALDNTPLAGLLQRLVPLERLPKLLAQRQLHGAGGHGVTLQHGRACHLLPDMHTPVAPWLRQQRIAVPTAITLQHLLASSAIPFIFPPTRVDGAAEAGLVRRRLDAADGAAVAGHPPGRRAAADHRRRPHAGPAGAATARRGAAHAGPGGRACHGQHLPGRTGGRHRAHAAHQPHPGAAARRAPGRPRRCGRWNPW